MVDMLKEISMVRAGKCYTMQAGKRYRVTYWSGKVLEFLYRGTPAFDPTSIYGADAWNVTMQRPAGYKGFCTESVLNLCKAEEV